MEKRIVQKRESLGNLSAVEVVGAEGIQRIVRGAENSGSHPKQALVPAILEFAEVTEDVIGHDYHSATWFQNQEGGRITRSLFYNLGWEAPDDTGRDDDHGHVLYEHNMATAPDKVVSLSILVAGFGGTLRLYGENTTVTLAETRAWEKLHERKWDYYKALKNMTAEQVRAEDRYRKDNPLLRQYWRSPNNSLANFRHDDTVFIGDRALVGGVDEGAHNIRFERDYFLDCTLALGHRASGGYVSATDSLILGSVAVDQSGDNGYRDPATGAMASWDEAVFGGNTVILGVGQRVRAGLPTDRWQWGKARSVYYVAEAKSFAFRKYDRATDKPGASRRLTFAQWRDETGFDERSECFVGKPDTIVRCIPMDVVVNGHVGNVVIVNPKEQPVVAADLTPLGLQIGGRYRLHQARDYFGDVRDFVYEGEPVKIEMSGTIAPILGWREATPPSLPPNGFPRYGVFWLERLRTAEEHIAELEAEVERLGRALERCREEG